MSSNRGKFTPEMELDIETAVAEMRRGGIILYPTDTIWGIGCDATCEDAVKKIYDLKHRADNKSMLVLVDSLDMLKRYVYNIPEVAYELIDVAIKPMTIIYDNSVGLPDVLTGEGGSIGVRITSDPFSRELIRRLHRPIVSTSANVSGEKSATFFAEISEAIRSGVDYVVKYRQEDKEPHEASTIIMLSHDGQVKVLRP